MDLQEEIREVVYASVFNLIEEHGRTNKRSIMEVEQLDIKSINGLPKASKWPKKTTILVSPHGTVTFRESSAGGVRLATTKFCVSGMKISFDAKDEVVVVVDAGRFQAG